MHMRQLAYEIFVNQPENPCIHEDQHTCQIANLSTRNYEHYAEVQLLA